MKPRPITLYAIVDKKKPRLDVMDIYTKEQASTVVYNKKTEKIIKVTVSAS